MKKFLLLLFGGVLTFNAIGDTPETTTPAETNVIVVEPTEVVVIEPAANSTQTAPKVAANRTESLLLCILPGVPSASKDTEVNGAKIGLPISGGTAMVNGIEVGVLGAANEKVNGIQCSLIATAGKQIDGLQLSLVNLADNVNGVQIGIFNYSENKSFQVGLLNYMPKSSIPLMPFINYEF